MSPQDTDVRPGGTPVVPDVPDFDLIRPVGSGGFGQVWLATNRTTGHLARSSSFPCGRRAGAIPRRGRSVRLSAWKPIVGRQHPNLLDDSSRGPDVPAPVLCDGPGRRRRGRAGLEPGRITGPPRCSPGFKPGLLSPEVCLDYAGQLLAGLASLHAAGMVHRDVKPANCLFVGGQLKLADFGLVTEAHPLVSRVGTQKYMPPDGRMDMRADVYAAGLVIYEIITRSAGRRLSQPGSAGQSRLRNNPILAALLRLVLARV